MLRGLSLPARSELLGPGLRAAGTIIRPPPPPPPTHPTHPTHSLTKPPNNTHANTTPASLGGLRGVRQGRRAGDRDVQEFLEDAVTPRGARGSAVGAGRGSGSYERFIKAHKDTVLSEEDKRFKTWSNWKDQLEDFEEDPQEDLTTEEQGYLGSVMENEGFEGEGDYKPGSGDRNRRDRRGRRGGRGDDAAMMEDLGSYFDWGDDSVFIPRMPERDEVDGSFTTDRIGVKDDLQLRVNKLLWRRLKIQSRDMDQHVPRAFRRSKALTKAMAETRQRLANAPPAEEEGEVAGAEAAAEDAVLRQKAAAKKSEDEDNSSDSSSSSSSSSSSDDDSDDEEKKVVARRKTADPAVKEVRRLNAAKTIDAIEAELGRLLVEGKMDLQLAQDETRSRRWAAAGRHAGLGAEGGGEEDEDHDEEEEDEEEEEEMAGMDDWSKIHMQDLEEALGDEIPTTDLQEEGFEAFRQYAEQLIEAGGVIEYRSTLAGKYDREMNLPLPLATGKALRQALRKDQAALAKTPALATANKALGAAPDYDATAAFAWLALSKNPSMGDTTRTELSDAMTATLRRLQEEPSRLDRARARAAAGGGGGKPAGGGGGRAGGGGGGGGKGKGGGKAKAKAK